jgi:hypothetical protein
MDSTPSATRSKKEALRLIGEALILLASSDDEPSSSTPKYIHVSTAALAPLGLGPECVRSAIEKGELRASLGSRRRLLVEESALIAWRDSRKVQIRPRRARKLTGINVDPIDQMIARGELKRAR